MRTVHFVAALLCLLVIPVMLGAGLSPSTEGVPIIQVDTPAGPATISGPGAEWLLETGFPIGEDYDECTD